MRVPKPKAAKVKTTIRDLTVFEKSKANVDPQFPKGTGFRQKPKAPKAKGLLS